jgi:predicted amidohydrolase YtcJ
VKVLAVPNMEALAFTSDGSIRHCAVALWLLRYRPQRTFDLLETAVTKADLIVTNARVLTMDARFPTADAVAVAGNTILAVGSRAEVEALKSKHTRVIDARAGTVTPGLIEGHIHLFMGAAELDNLNLAGVVGMEGLTPKVRSYAAGRPKLKLVFANQASYTLLGDAVTPTRHDLDRVLPDRPFAMMTYDHHTVYANTKALQLAGVLGGASVPTGSQIVMGKDGLATGELIEPGAFRYILALTPTAGRDALGFTEAADPNPVPTTAERAIDRALMLRGQKYCAAYGFASAHNMDGNFYQLELLEEIDNAGDCHLRCQSPFHFKNTFSLSCLVDAVEMKRRYASERVSSGRIKLFMDGVLESWTALTLEDYPDKPGCFGAPNFEAAEFNALAIEADRLGLQMSVHAIADGAVRRTLDGFSAARAANGPRDARHRIEHIETIHPADLPRLAELGVVASMQPTHAPGVIFPEQPGLSRIRPRDLPYAYAWETIRKTGGHIMFNSDWPVSPIAPMLSIKGAMTRKTFRPGDPAQRQTLMQALAGYTTGAAYGEHMEHKKGMLRPGMLADIAVWSADLERTEPDALTDVTALATVCDGKVTHHP